MKTGHLLDAVENMHHRSSETFVRVHIYTLVRDRLWCSLEQTRSRYFRFAVQLKQVSHFYNTMSDQILPCQKIMVLQPAMQFDRLFSDMSKGKMVEWDRVEELEIFTEKVRDGAEKLRSVNRRLRRAHQVPRQNSSSDSF